MGVKVRPPNNFYKITIGPATAAATIRLVWRLFTITIVTVITCAQFALAAPKQHIFSLSQDQQNSEILKVWAVPACVQLGSERPRGLYITGFTGDGLARNLDLAVGDVLLSINGRVLLSAKQADEILVSTKSGPLKAVLARVSNTPAGISLLNPKINYVASPLNQTYGAGGIVGGSGPLTSGSSAVVRREKVDSQTIAALEDYMFALVNADRAANGGLPPLSRSTTLGALARRYADNMARRKFFAHNDPDGNQPRDRARQAGIHASVWENLAMESGSRPLRELVLRGEQQMMAEPPNQINHRGCILHTEHHCVGIGVAVVEDRVLCVQEYSPANLP